MTKRKLNERELEYLVNHLSDIESDVDPFDTDDDGDLNYETETDSSSKSSENEQQISEDQDDDGHSKDGQEDAGQPTDEDKEIHNENGQEDIRPSIEQNDVVGSYLAADFCSKFDILEKKSGEVDSAMRRTSEPLQIFKKMFPPSLMIFIADYTNKRLAQLEQKQKKKITREELVDDVQDVFRKKLEREKLQYVECAKFVSARTFSPHFILRLVFSFGNKSILFFCV